MENLICLFLILFLAISFGIVYGGGMLWFAKKQVDQLSDPFGLKRSRRRKQRRGDE